MSGLLSKFLSDPNALIAAAALIVAVVSARVAVRQAREKDRLSALRAHDLSLFVRTIEQILHNHEHFPAYIRHVMDETKTLIQTTHEQTQDVIATSIRETKKAIGELSEASKILEEVFTSLRQVTNVALRSQRDSAKAHRQLMLLLKSGGHQQDQESMVALPQPDPRPSPQMITGDNEA